MGCDRDAVAGDFSCVVVRCEEDFSVGLHVYSSRRPNALGRWALTLDREDRQVEIVSYHGPYSGRILENEAWLLERLKQGAYIYIAHVDDKEAPFRFISLAGSLLAIEEALYWCAPRAPASEQNAAPGVELETQTGELP